VKKAELRNIPITTINKLCLPAATAIILPANVEMKPIDIILAIIYSSGVTGDIAIEFKTRSLFRTK
jgi:hypothetical protein